MNLQKIARKLRHVAETIDSLFIDTDNENPVIAREIVKQRRRTKKSAKGFKYGKSNPHWTQLPENKVRLAKMVRKAARSKKQA